MITKLKAKPLKRETGASERTRAIAVELYPCYCRIWVKGTREVHAVAWTAILDLGRKLDFREQLAQRKDLGRKQDYRVQLAQGKRA